MRTLVLPPPRRSRALPTHALRAATLALMLLGYADLVRGGTTAAALLLVASYLLLVPLAILLD
jgi:hypothetical protein